MIHNCSYSDAYTMATILLRGPYGSLERALEAHLFSCAPWPVTPSPEAWVDGLATGIRLHVSGKQADWQVMIERPSTGTMVRLDEIRTELNLMPLIEAYEHQMRDGPEIGLAAEEAAWARNLT